MTTTAPIALKKNLLLFTLAAAFFAPGVSPAEQRSLALTSNQTLKAKLIWEEGSGPAPSASHHLTVGFTQSDEPSRVGVTRPAFRGYQESLYDEVVLAMAVGPGLFGDLEVNHAIQWKFKRNISFWHEGTHHFIDQAKLEKYPNLLSRLKQLTFSFARIDVRTFANHSPVKFSLGSEFFVVAGDGQEPYAPVPYSPAKWSDVVTFNEYVIMTDKESYKAWKELKSVHVLGVDFVNLKVPYDGLAAVARDFEKLEKTEAEADKKTETLKKELEQTSSLPAYRQGGDLAEAFEAPAGEVFEETGKTPRIGLRTKSGKVVFSAPRSEISKIEPLAGSRVFQATATDGSAQLLSRSGKPLKFDGVSKFQRIEFKNGQLELTQVLKRTPLEFQRDASPCYFNPAFDRHFASLGDAENAFRKAVDSRLKREQQEAAEYRKAHPGRKGDLQICLPNHFSVHEELRRLATLPGRVLSSETVFVLR